MTKFFDLNVLVPIETSGMRPNCDDGTWITFRHHFSEERIDEMLTDLFGWLTSTSLVAAQVRRIRLVETN